MKILNKKISSKKSSAEWMRRQLSDPYVERAKKEGFRARAAYKLAEIDERFHLFKNARVVVDLGAAPGSWAQYVKRARPSARVIAMDILPIKPIDGVEFYQGDFTEGAALDWLDSRLAAEGRRACDVVLSDMAPNTTGHQKTDHLRQTTLLEYAFDFARNNLKRGGSFVAKSFTGGTTASLLAEIKKAFKEVRHVKPAASRKDSVEMFIVALGFREASVSDSGQCQ